MTRSVYGRHHLYLHIAILWLLLTVVLCAAIIGFDLSRAGARFQEQSHALFEYLNYRVETSKTVLDGFTALLASSNQARPEERRIAHYAEQMLQRYPFIYMLEIAERVERQESEQFIAAQRQRGRKDFSIKAFDFTAGKSWLPLEEKPYYYPIVFMRPLLPEAREVMGLDVDSNEYFRRALVESARLQRPVSSYPFELIEGERAYMMHSAVLSPDQSTAARYGLLLIKAGALLPEEPQPAARSLRVYHTDFEEGDPAGLLVHVGSVATTRIESVLFPRLAFTRVLPDPGQPFVVRIDQQLRWTDINLPLLALVFSGATFTFLLLLFYARAHHQHELKQLLEADRLFRLANYDSLTGLPNRNLLLDRLQHAQQRAYRQEMSLAVLFIDLDKFKLINDTFGHDGGDVLLRAVAQRLRECVRESDTLARLAGDEFVVVLEDCDRDDPARVARKIEEAFMAPFDLHDKVVYIRASVGVACYPEHGSEIELLIRHADNQMYAQKLQQRSASG